MIKNDGVNERESLSQSPTAAVTILAFSNFDLCKFRDANRVAFSLNSTPTTDLNRLASGKVKSPAPQ
jgi:hypothetical protein